MCDHIKDINFLRKQYNKSIENNIEIIQVEFISGDLRYRDRWSVKNILDKEEISRLDKEEIEKKKYKSSDWNK